MSLNDLSHAERTVIKGLARQGGSTSETLAYAFTVGDLSKFTGIFESLQEAWDRLDVGQQDAVIAIREAADLGRHDFDLGHKVVPTRETFLDEFVAWKRKQMIGQYEYEWYAVNSGDDLPDSERHRIEKIVDQELAQHL